MSDKLKTSTWTWKPNIVFVLEKTSTFGSAKLCRIKNSFIRIYSDIFKTITLSTGSSIFHNTHCFPHYLQLGQCIFKNQYVLLFCSSWTSRAPAWLFKVNPILSSWQTCFVVLHFIHILASCDLALLLFLITFRSSVQPSRWSSQKSAPSFLCAREARVQMWPDRGEYKARQESQGDQPRSAALEQQQS